MLVGINRFDSHNSYIYCSTMTMQNKRKRPSCAAFAQHELLEHIVGLSCDVTCSGRDVAGNQEQFTAAYDCIC